MNFPIFLKKFDNYSFVSANYSPGMKYGKSTTTNVAISPQFLTKMANDSDLEDEYIKEIGNMKKLDEQFAKQQADIGWRVEQGWAIDKDGNISSWAIGHKDSKEALTLEQQEKLLQFVEQSNVYKPHLPMMQVMFGACLRVSETIGLTWSDVDMKNREIHVGGQLVYYEGDEGYCFHDSELGENNVNPKVMQYVMGHSDAQITMNVYNHIAEKSHVENEMSKMNLPETVPAVV